MALNTAAIESELATLENKVEDMKSLETSLVTQLDNLRSSLKKHKNRMAQLHNLRMPINSLPNEILIEIFKSGPSTPWNSLDYVMNISQVICRWRAAAISTPSLWAFVHVGFLSWTKWLRLMEVFLERSGSHALDIVVHFDRNCPKRRSQPHNPLKDLRELHERLLFVVNRLRRVIIVGNKPEDVFLILRPFRLLCAPLLEILEVKAQEEEFRWDTPDPLLIFEGGAPKLNRLKVEGISLSSCQPPKSSIVSLHLGPHENTSLSEIETAIAGANNITDLHLLGRIQIDSVGVPEFKIPSIRSLSVSIDPAPPFDDLIYFLCGLQAPNLEKLIVHCTFLSRRKPDFNLFSGDYQHPRLLSLTLHCSATIRSWEAACFITMFPSITHLTLEVDTYGSFERLLLALLPDDPDPDPEECEEQQKSGSLAWPRLHIITLAAIPPEDERDLDALYDVISSRISRGAPIGCIQIPSLEYIPAETLKWLQERVTVEEFSVWEMDCEDVEDYGKSGQYFKIPGSYANPYHPYSSDDPQYRDSSEEPSSTPSSR